MLDMKYLEQLLPMGSGMAPVKGGHPAVTLPISDPSFLPPPLKAMHGDASKAGSAIVIVSAPGAVGKSAFARRLATSRAIPLWDLSKLKLGDNSFVGTIANCFGPENLATIIKSLKSGTGGFVFDAMDEAEILSGWQRIESFLNELITQTQGCTRPCLVLLARSETANFLSYYLEDKSVSHLVFEIDYFNEDSSKTFIERQIEKIARDRSTPEIAQRLHQHTVPFNDAMQAIFYTIYATFNVGPAEAWADFSVRSFLGYAPVLQAIATYLASFSNYLEVSSTTKQGRFSKDGPDTTTNIMKDLLYREHEKVVQALRNKTIPGLESFAAWDSIYTPQEQLVRILFIVLGMNADDFVDFGMISTLLVEHYLSAVKSFLPQHPFLRGSDFSGPAFRDFTFSELLKSSDPDIRTMTRGIMEKPTYVATPLLLQFYCSDGTELIHGEDAGFFYESASSRDMISDLATAIVLLPPSMSGASNHLFEFVREDSTNSQPELPSLFIRPSPQLCIVFNRRLRNALIYVDGQVTLGHPGNDFEISDSEVFCGKIQLNSGAFIVQSSLRAESVVINAAGYGQLAPTVDVQIRGPGTLWVSWPGSKQHPWALFSREVVRQSEDGFEQRMYLSLRKILTWFKRDKKKDLARHRDLIRNAAVGMNPDRQNIFAYLLERRFVYEDAYLYKLDDKALSSAGIHYADVRACRETPATHAFFEEFKLWLHERAG